MYTELLAKVREEADAFIGIAYVLGKLNFKVSVEGLEVVTLDRESEAYKQLDLRLRSSMHDHHTGLAKALQELEHALKCGTSR